MQSIALRWLRWHRRQPCGTLSFFGSVLKNQPSNVVSFVGSWLDPPRVHFSGFRKLSYHSNILEEQGAAETETNKISNNKSIEILKLVPLSPEISGFGPVGPLGWSNRCWELQPVRVLLFYLQAVGELGCRTSMPRSKPPLVPQWYALQSGQPMVVLKQSIVQNDSWTGPAPMWRLRPFPKALCFGWPLMSPPPAMAPPSTGIRRGIPKSVCRWLWLVAHLGMVSRESTSIASGKCCSTRPMTELVVSRNAIVGPPPSLPKNIGDWFSKLHSGQ